MAPENFSPKTKDDTDELARVKKQLKRTQERLREIDQVLRESEVLYDTLVENLPLNVCRKDKDGVFVFVNAPFCKKVNLLRGEILGKTDYELSDRKLADEYRADDKKIEKTGESLEFVEEHTEKNGEPTFIQMYKMPVLDADGNFNGIQCFFFDVTKLKLAEAALKERSSELEGAMATLKENQEKLILTERMASIGKLSEGIGHGMLTPLTATESALTEIQSMFESICESAGDEGIAEKDKSEFSALLKIAKNANTRSVTFLKHLSLETHNLQPRTPRRFNAIPFIRETIAILQYAARKANCTIEYQAQDESMELFGPAERLGQIVSNLVNNAIDATETAGGGTITVRTYSDAGHHNLLVSDEGPGISKDLLPNIFDPMFTTKPVGEGTGLGLSIVKDIVSGEFDGSVSADAETSKGAAFHIRFPQSDETPPPRTKTGDVEI